MQQVIGKTAEQLELGDAIQLESGTVGVVTHARTYESLSGLNPRLVRLVFLYPEGDEVQVQEGYSWVRAEQNIGVVVLS